MGRKYTHRLAWMNRDRCWVVAYADPRDGRRRLLYCTPSRFEAMGIPIGEDDSVVRRKSKRSEALATQLRDRFFTSLPTNAARPGQRSLSDAADTYEALYAANQSAGWRKSLRAGFDDLIKVIGDVQVADLTDVHLSDYESELRTRDLSPYTVRRYIDRVMALVVFCRRKGWLIVDPTLTYRRPATPRIDPKHFSDDDVAAFFRLTRDPPPKVRQDWDHLWWWGVGYLFLGLRPVELERARWDWVDLDERMLWVGDTHAGKMQSVRHQPIPLCAIEEFRRRQSDGLVWRASRGGPATPGAQSRSRKSVATHIDGFTWKRWRKTFATQLHRARADQVIVSRLLGHAGGGHTVADRHYIGQVDHFHRSIVDDALSHYATLVWHQPSSSQLRIVGDQAQ